MIQSTSCRAYFEKFAAVCPLAPGQNLSPERDNFANGYFGNFLQRAIGHQNLRFRIEAFIKYQNAEGCEPTRLDPPGERLLHRDRDRRGATLAVADDADALFVDPQLRRDAPQPLVAQPAGVDDDDRRPPDARDGGDGGASFPAARRGLDETILSAQNSVDHALLEIPQLDPVRRDATAPIVVEQGIVPGAPLVLCPPGPPSRPQNRPHTCHAPAGEG